MAGKTLGKYIGTFSSHVLTLEDCLPAFVIFDDYILENENEVQSYFTRKRHKQLDCFYLAQTFSKVPKQIDRDNTFYVYFQGITNLKNAYDEYAI